jgi:hypothetical protein
LAIAALGFALGAAYWFVAYEVAGTILLLGFGLATGIVGVVLGLDRRARQVAARARAGAAREDGVDARPMGEDVAGGGTGQVDRPFADETGRLPSETLAPFAAGLGIATAFTAVIFGPALLVAGALPLGWGVRAWLTGASEEYRATAADDMVETRSGAAADRLVEGPIRDHTEVAEGQSRDAPG